MPSIPTERAIDFAILTAIEIERKAVCAAFGLTSEHRVRHGGRTYWRGRLPLKNGEYYEILVAQPRDMGQVEAALLVSDVIKRWQPSAALLVGIAASTDKNVKLGDVVIGRCVYYYEHGKVTLEGTKPQPEMILADAALLDAAVTLDWEETILKRPDGSEVQPKRHLGVIASGEKVIASEVARDAITASNRKILALEMEGYGFSRAVWQNFERVRHLDIRGICDDGNSAKNDEWHSYAAATAARFTKHFLLDRPLEPFTRPANSTVDVLLDTKRAGFHEYSGPPSSPTDGLILVVNGLVEDQLSFTIASRSTLPGSKRHMETSRYVVDRIFIKLHGWAYCPRRDESSVDAAFVETQTYAIEISEEYDEYDLIPLEPPGRTAAWTYMADDFDVFKVRLRFPPYVLFVISVELEAHDLFTSASITRSSLPYRAIRALRGNHGGCLNVEAWYDRSLWHSPNLRRRYIEGIDVATHQLLIFDAQDSPDYARRFSKELLQSKLPILKEFADRDPCTNVFRANIAAIEGIVRASS